MQTTFDPAENSDWKDVITVKSSLTGKMINRFTHLPQNPFDLPAETEDDASSGDESWWLHTNMHGAGCYCFAFIATKETDDKLGTNYHQRFMTYLKDCQGKDWAGAWAQTDMKGDRRPHKQEGPDAYVHIVGEEKMQL